MYQKMAHFPYKTLTTPTFSRKPKKTFNIFLSPITEQKITFEWLFVSYAYANAAKNVPTYRSSPSFNYWNTVLLFPQLFPSWHNKVKWLAMSKWSKLNIGLTKYLLSLLFIRAVFCSMFIFIFKMQFFLVSSCMVFMIGVV